MTSRHNWNPHQIQFPQTKYGVQEEIEGRNVSAILIFAFQEDPHQKFGTTYQQTEEGKL